ncbi:MAG: S8 family serine peptidase [Candidatus Omnitrophota bacterium]
MRKIDLIRNVVFVTIVLIALPVSNICYSIEEDNIGISVEGSEPRYQKSARPEVIKTKKSNQYEPNQLIIKLKEGKQLTNIQGLNLKYNIASAEKVFSDIVNPKQALNNLKDKLSKLDSQEHNKWYWQIDKDSQEYEDYITRIEQEKEAIAKQIEAKEKLVSRMEQAQGNAKQIKDPHLENIYLLRAEEDTDVILMAREYSSNPLVEYAEPNYIYTVQMFPDDPYYQTKGSWEQEFDDLYGLKPDKLNCEAAWDITQGEGMVVAVIDTGIDKSHEDLAGNVWVNAGEIPANGIDDDGNGYVDDVNGWDFVNKDNDPKDGHGHGTHCSGTIAGIGNNNIGVIGVAPKAKIMALKGLSDKGEGDSEVLAQCVIYAVDNGADVLSNSWGGTGISQTLTDAFHYAYNNGVVAVAAAGNSNKDVKDFMPANIDTVISIAATDDEDLKASFSNWGDVDVAAPGVQILSARSAGTDMYGDGKHIVGDKYYWSNGTSMACPHVAGVCALIMSHIPLCPPDTVRQYLRMTADELAADPANDSLGCGRVNAHSSLSDPCFVEIVEPVSGVISNKAYIDVYALAYGDKFSYYTLDYRKGADEWIPIVSEVHTQFTNPAVVGRWDTSCLVDGIYTLRLRVYTDDQPAVVSTSRVTITVDNLKINSPKNGEYLPVKSSYAIKGIACGVGFQRYIVEYSLKDSGIWSEDGMAYDGTAVKTIDESVLAEFDTSVLAESGTYELKVSVYYDTGYSIEEVTAFIYDSQFASGFPVWIENHLFTGESDLNVLNMPDNTKQIILSYNKRIILVDSHGNKKEILRSDLIAPPEGASFIYGGGISVGDMGDGKEKIFTHLLLDKCSTEEQNYYQRSSAYESDGSCVAGWPQHYDGPISYEGFSSIVFGNSTVINDMDNDGKPEMAMKGYVVKSWDSSWHTDSLLFLFNSDGTLVDGWPLTLTGGYGDSCSDPIVADLNNDGKKEVLVWTSIFGLMAYAKDGQMMPGWQISNVLQYSKNAVNEYYDAGRPAVADLNKDGKYEIAIRDSNGWLYLFDNLGHLLDKVLIYETDTPGSPGVEMLAVDINRDGVVELAAGYSTGGGFDFYQCEGNNLVKIQDFLELQLPWGTNFVIADINNDKEMELIAAVGNGFEGKISAYNFDGQCLWSKTLSFLVGGVVLTDLDNDGKMELVSLAADYSCGGIGIVAWDLDGLATPENMPWPQAGHDPQRTGMPLPQKLTDNHVPVVDVGVDQAVVLPEMANLSGSVSDDSLPNPPGELELLWFKVSGPGEVTFTDAHMAETTASFSKSGEYLLALTVDDGELVGRDELVVTVQGTPDIKVSPGVITATAAINKTAARILSIQNTGNGELNFDLWTSQGESALPSGKELYNFQLNMSTPSGGIAVDGKYLWVASIFGNDIKKVNLEENRVVETFNPPGVLMVESVAVDNGKLWIGEMLSSQKIRCYDIATKSLLKTFNCPSTYKPTGLAVDNNVVYLSCAMTSDGKGMMYRIDANSGTCIGSYTPHMPINDFTIYKGALWHTDTNTLTPTVYRINPVNGQVLDSFEIKLDSGYSMLWGVSAARGRLWLGDLYTIHQIDLSEVAWMSLLPQVGSVASGSVQNIAVAFDASLAGAGTHEASIHVNSNDPDEPEVEIPVTFIITTSANSPPAAHNQSVVISEDETKAITLTGEDPDADALAYVIVSEPAYGTLSGTAPDLIYTPNTDYNGIDSFIFKVNDAIEDSSAATVSITIEAVNDAPVLDYIEDISVNEGETVMISANADDLEADALTYSYSGWMTSESCTTGYDDAGTHTVTVTVSDGELSDSQDITVTVENVNRAPELAMVGERTVSENTLLKFTVSASDPDADALTYSAANLPQGAVFDAQSRTFSWTPGDGQAGTYTNIHFEVTDGNLKDSEDIIITVITSNQEDVNGDGQIDALDLQLCVNVIMGTAESIPSADVNGDGVVGAVDIQMIVNKILS